MRTLVIGDIHGCWNEFQDLLDKAGVTSDDQIIAIGDLVNRGPKSKKVLNFFRKGKHPNSQVILGNHERGHINTYDMGKKPSVSMMQTRWQLGDNYNTAIEYMRTMPAYIELPDALLVHAYYEAGVSLEDQRPDVITGSMVAEKYLAETYDCPWYERYDRDEPLICGHRDWSGDMTPFIYKDRVFSIDTRCVYGGSLTGLWLPDFTLVSVPSREDHWLAFRERWTRNPR